ncbi:MAG TPA: STAS/SEC14 domain-containing protein [Acidimicrobiia bacterium]|nr:STAS/SEC14 domain-containing protein [Acidimicrobiia bacterium]
MLEGLQSPDTVLAFRAVGTVEESDYDTVLEPAVEQMMADRGQLRFVYVLGDEFDGYSFAAGWEDAKLGMSHLTKWKRCAVVTSHDWVRHFVGMFRWMMPGDLKVFELPDFDAAIAWAAA